MLYEVQVQEEEVDQEEQERLLDELAKGSHMMT